MRRPERGASAGAVNEQNRNKREKSLIKTELTEIKGIGSETAQSLLSKLKSVNNIKKASLSELEKIIGNAKAKIVYTYFHS